MKEKLAIFDVDGTLFDGNLGIEFVKLLVSQNVFRKEIGEGIFGWYGKYKNGEAEKSIVVDEIYKLYAEGMKGLTDGKADEIANQTWESVKNKLFPFAIQIVQDLKDKGFMVLLLSGSPMEMILKLGKHLGVEVENTVAGTLEIVDGIYTGNIISYPGSSEKKVEALTGFIDRRKIEIDWNASFGFGDNERDFGILERVGHPVAINPNEMLLARANKDGWTVTSGETTLEKMRQITATVA